VRRISVESLTAIDRNVPLTATKPIRFFDPENNDLPDVIDLHFRRAPGFERFFGSSAAPRQGDLCLRCANVAALTLVRRRETAAPG
jgi:hypothetical protein